MSLNTHSETMKKVKDRQPGGAEVLSIFDGKIPMPGPREVLVKVVGAGINRPDEMHQMVDIRCRAAYPSMMLWMHTDK